MSTTTISVLLASNNANSHATAAALAKCVGGAFSPLVYGAVGDGNNDDTAAIQAALDAAGAAGGKVFIPTGTYKLTAAIQIGSNTHLHMSPGCTLTLASGANCPLIRNKNWSTGAITDTNIVITGGTLFCNGVCTGSGGTGLYNIDDSLANGTGNFNQTYAANVTVSGHGPGVGLALFGVDHLAITDVQVQNARSYGIAAINITDFRIVGNEVTTNLAIGGDNTDGIHIDGPASNGVVAENWGTSQDDFIALNADDGRLFLNAATSGAITGVAVVDNHFVQCVNGIRLLSANALLDDVRVSGNWGKVTGILLSAEPFAGMGGNGNFGSWSFDNFRGQAGSTPILIGGNHLHITMDGISLKTDLVSTAPIEVGYRSGNYAIGKMTLTNMQVGNDATCALQGIVNLHNCTIGDLILANNIWTSAGTQFHASAALVINGAASHINRVVAGGNDVPKLFSNTTTIGSVRGPDYGAVVFESKFVGFNGTNSATLANYQPEVGPKWTAISGATASVSGGSAIFAAGSDKFFYIDLGIPLTACVQTYYVTPTASNSVQIRPIINAAQTLGITISFNPEQGNVVVYGATTGWLPNGANHTTSVSHKMVVRLENGNITVTLDDTDSVTVAIPTNALNCTCIAIGESTGGGSVQSVTVRRL